jgi:hypothetical protein
MELTDWVSCKTPPVRDGWYGVQRWMHGKPWPKERVRFQDGAWDRQSCESKIAIWSGYDYWRGVTEESKGGE